MFIVEAMAGRGFGSAALPLTTAGDFPITVEAMPWQIIQ